MRILDLGCGDLIDANAAQGEVIAIDRRPAGQPASHVSFIEGDYFEVPLEGEFDLIYARHSLCFNKQETIEHKLPEILAHLKNGGKFQVFDFHTDEKVVMKRTNLYADWFFRLIEEQVGPYALKDEEVYDKNHGHMHHVFELEAVKLK